MKEGVSLSSGVSAVLFFFAGLLRLMGASVPLGVVNRQRERAEELPYIELVALRLAKWQRGHGVGRG